MIYNLNNTRDIDNFDAGDSILVSGSWQQYEIILPRGKYSVALLGAAGGDSYYLGRSDISNIESICKGGRGAYVRGCFELPESTQVWLTPGTPGTWGKNPKGGYNGGAPGFTNYDRFMTSGGGASDIRFEKNDLLHRVAVAGGGGGAYETCSSSNLSSYTGRGGGGDFQYGLTGAAPSGNTYCGKGGYYYDNGTMTDYNANRTTTTTTYASGTTYKNWLRGGFGVGGGAWSAANITQGYVNGGGGGWFGGGAGAPDGGAGGGSSFFFGRGQYWYNYGQSSGINRTIQTWSTGDLAKAEGIVGERGFTTDQATYPFYEYQYFGASAYAIFATGVKQSTLVNDSTEFGQRQTDPSRGIYPSQTTANYPANSDGSQPRNGQIVIRCLSRSYATYFIYDGANWK